MGKSGNMPAPPIQQTSSTIDEGFGATSAMLSQMMAQMNNAMMGYNQAMMSMQDTMRQSLIATPDGEIALSNVKNRMKVVLDEVTDNELNWTDKLFEGRSILGTNAKQIKQFVLFAVRDVANFIGIESNHKLPKENPMPFLVKWMDMAAMQAAPQEQDHGQYKFNTVAKDHTDEVFDI